MLRTFCPYLSALALSAFVPGCGHPDVDPAVTTGTGTPFADGAEERSPAATLAPPGEATKAAPVAPFPEGQRAFEIVLKTLRERYYGQGLTDDQLYRAATQG